MKKDSIIIIPAGGSDIEFSWLQFVDDNPSHWIGTVTFKEWNKLSHFE